MLCLCVKLWSNFANNRNRHCSHGPDTESQPYAWLYVHISSCGGGGGGDDLLPHHHLHILKQYMHTYIQCTQKISSYMHERPCPGPGQTLEGAKWVKCHWFLQIWCCQWTCHTANEVAFFARNVYWRRNDDRKECHLLVEEARLLPQAFGKIYCKICLSQEIKDRMINATFWVLQCSVLFFIIWKLARAGGLVEHRIPKSRVAKFEHSLPMTS